MVKEQIYSKRQYISVSKALFAVKGYAATTTRTINEQMGGAAKGLLYYYFPHGKREILSCILKQNAFSKLDQLSFDFDQATNCGELEEKLMTAFMQIWQSFQSRPIRQLVVIIIRERLLLTDEESQLITGAWQKIADKLAAALIDCSLCQPLGKGHCHSLAEVLVSIFQKTISDAILISNDQQLSAKMKSQTQLQIHYLLQIIHQE